VQDGNGDATRLLGLTGLAVEAVSLTPLGIRLVQLVTVDPEAARCPDCRELSTSGKEWVLTRPRDLPVGGEPVLLQWRKRRWRCRTADCPRRSFTEQVPEVPARARTTTRLRTRLATAVEDGRCQAEVATTFGVSWPTVQRAVIAHARRALGEPQPTAVLGLDETRFGRPRWIQGPSGWMRTEPWETGFVDLAGGQGLLGQVDGRTTAAVRGWLAARSAEFRDAVQLVVIDPHAGYARAVREEPVTIPV
jgi:transposase